MYCQNKVIIYQISDMQLIPFELQPTLSILHHKEREACLINYKEAKLFHQAPVVQTLDSAIHRINHYPADKY